MIPESLVFVELHLVAKNMGNGITNTYVYKVKTLPSFVRFTRHLFNFSLLVKLFCESYIIRTIKHEKITNLKLTLHSQSQGFSISPPQLLQSAVSRGDLVHCVCPPIPVHRESRMAPWKISRSIKVEGKSNSQ
jgi:hypothetical protein